MAKPLMKPIVIKGLLFNADKQARAIENVLGQQAKAAKVDVDSVMLTWKGSPKSTIRRDGRFIRTVFTDDERAKWVDDGTRPHTIRPRTARRLAFRANYKAKTSPGFIGSRRGGSSGPVILAREVRHPGTKARRFTQEIAKKQGKLLPLQIERAILAEMKTK